MFPQPSLTSTPNYISPLMQVFSDAVLYEIHFQIVIFRGDTRWQIQKQKRTKIINFNPIDAKKSGPEGVSGIEVTLTQPRQHQVENERHHSLR